MVPSLVVQVHLQLPHDTFGIRAHHFVYSSLR